MKQIILLFSVLGLLWSSNLSGQSGCTDINACNYDPFAIQDDGSCIDFIDCAGICGGSFIEDACGNCYDPNNITFEDVNFEFTGSEQAWVVPDGVTNIYIQTFGAQGQNATNGGTGGRGASAIGQLDVTPGETLYIYVGGQNGFNGGGNPGTNGNNQGGQVIGAGGFGGGASDLRQGGNSLANRVLVAAGGGGGGNNGVWEGCQPSLGANGGFGGSANGSNGNNATSSACNCGNGGGTGGGGATQSAGGNAGGYAGGCQQTWAAPLAGTLGQGGNGSQVYHNGTGGGGGGGGGYYGGGAGGNGSDTTPGAGGGGGSSYINGAVNAFALEDVHSGNGVVIISYPNSVPECNAGCIDPNACNFEPEAEIDDNSCFYPDGCTDEFACNYAPNALCDDGSCTYPGCNNETACNFDPNAACDDGSCIFIIDCTGNCGGAFIEDACGNCYDPNNITFEDVNFEFTGSEQAWVVPDGVTNIYIQTFGAQGQNATNGGTGGRGASAIGQLDVTPGETLYIYVGGQNGFNGGGNPGTNGNNQGGQVIGAGGFGGGASDLRQGGNSLANRVLVAAGGGGGGNNGVWEGCQPSLGANGGFGGSANGSNGNNATSSACNCGNGGGTGGGGATQSAGGNAGGYAGGCQQTWAAPLAGTLGQGGNGSQVYHNGTGGGGGGGGGYYGGGAGGNGSDTTPGAGGGGGSSYINGAVNAFALEDVHSGNGVVIISYPNSVPNCQPGCTNESADNFDPNANFDDGSCIIQGCTNPLATNYVPEATLDNGSCIILGCTYAIATNFFADANTDDGSCIFEVTILGCTDVNSCNYNPDATIEDNSCDYSCIGCTYASANNYNANATIDDGSCTFGASEISCGLGTFWDPMTETCVAFTDCPADLNGDGIVNSTDLLTFLGAFGTLCE